jgi:rSAM/selenodomain-associated transferase 1
MTAVVVFGRQPRVGEVKTRLAVDLGGRPAAEVYGLLLEHTLAEAARCADPAILSLSDPPDEEWEPGARIDVEVQSPGTLGDRLADTFARRFSEGRSRVIVVGSDCPGLTSDHLDAGISALEAVPVVLGPAGDGGYWLVGQRFPGARLFAGIPWSSPDTLAATRRRLETLGLKWTELEELRDIDTRSDLEEALAAGRIPERLRKRLISVLEGTP